MDPDWISFYLIFGDFGRVIFNSPSHNASFPMVTYDAVLYINDTQPTHDANRIFLLIPFDLRIIDIQFAIFVDTDRRNQNSAWFHQIL